MFRNGQWVKFDGQGAREFQGAYRARDGKIVGIHHTATLLPVPSPATVTVVIETGENLDVNVGGMVLPVKVGLKMPGLVQVTDRRDIPPERIKHLPSDWQPMP